MVKGLHMRLRFFYLFLALAAPVAADVYERQPGVDVVHYDISLELDDASDAVRGTTRVRVRLLDDAPAMWLDFDGMAVDGLRVSGKAARYTYRNGRLAFSLPDPDIRRHSVVIEVQYHGLPSKGGLLIGKNRHNRRVFFVENWPDNAHRWFPCIDHPHDKATVNLDVAAPAHYTIVSNGRLAGTSSMNGGRKLTRWRESIPVPTYCMVFAAADFDAIPVGRPADVPLSYYCYLEDTQTVRSQFAHSSQAVDFFVRLLGRFPYEKLAQVEATTSIGGMENASAIFYAESLFAERAAAEEAPVPHEIAHQWFGDSVTEADWDHLWLSEGFATYLDALFREHDDGPAALKQLMESAAQKVRRLDENQPGPVVDPAQADPTKKLNAYNYEKGAWILHMLRGLIGERAFFDGLRRYYLLYKGKTALTEDFVRVMESVSGQPLTPFFDEWLKQPGFPHYRITWVWNPSAQAVDLTVQQEQADGLYDMPLEVVLRWESGADSRKIRVSKKIQTFRISAAHEPREIQVDPGGWVLKSLKMQTP